MTLENKMTDTPWTAWEMAAVDSKFITYLFQLLLRKGVVSAGDAQLLCSELIANLDRQGAMGAAQYARAVARDITGVSA